MWTQEGIAIDRRGVRVDDWDVLDGWVVFDG
jgi:hypothetical protein